jgi:tetratricopeptide (TPR) repeat protein
MMRYTALSSLCLLFLLVGFLIYRGAIQHLKASARTTAGEPSRLWSLCIFVLLFFNQVYLLWMVVAWAPDSAEDGIAIVVCQPFYGLAQILLIIGVVGIWLFCRPAYWLCGCTLGGLVIFDLIMVIVNGRSIIDSIREKPSLLLNGQWYLQLGVTALGPKIPLWPLVYTSACLDVLARWHIREARQQNTQGNVADPPASPATEPQRNEAQNYAPQRQGWRNRLALAALFVVLTAGASLVPFLHPICQLRRAEGHFGLGNAYHEKSDLTKAIAHYRKALDINPDHAEAHDNLGVALTKTTKPEGAIAHYRKALDINPNYAEAHNNLGLALKDKADVAGAHEHLRKAIEINPNYAEPHKNLGDVLCGHKDWGGAIAHYRKALVINPNFAEAHYGLGYALYYEKKDLNGAITHCRKALDAKPNFAYAYEILGLALLAKDQVREARAATQECLNLLSAEDPRRMQVQQRLDHCDKLLGGGK